MQRPLNNVKKKQAGDNIRAMSAGAWVNKAVVHTGFDNGHMLLWTQWANREDRPNFPKANEYSEKFGEAMSKWMIERSRNLCLYPNVYLMDQFGSQIRVLRPISVNKTEVTIYCIAPVGENAKHVHAVFASTKTSSMPQVWLHPE